MKLTKGLLLIIGISILAISDIKANPNTDTIKENIFIAIRSIDYASINVLLSDKTHVDTVDRKGKTPLMAAAKVGNTRIIDIILSHGPNINKQNKKGTTALMIAAKTGQFAVVEKLVNHGARLTIRDQDGNTALTLASKFGHDKIVDFFKRSQRQVPLAK